MIAAKNFTISAAGIISTRPNPMKKEYMGNNAEQWVGLGNGKYYCISTETFLNSNFRFNQGMPNYHRFQLRGDLFFGDIF